MDPPDNKLMSIHRHYYHMFRFLTSFPCWYTFRQTPVFGKAINQRTQAALCLTSGSRCNPRPVATGRVSCVCDWLRDATGLDFGDRSWICNAALFCVRPCRRVFHRRHNVTSHQRYQFWSVCIKSYTSTGGSGGRGGAVGTMEAKRTSDQLVARDAFVST